MPSEWYGERFGQGGHFAGVLIDILGINRKEFVGEDRRCVVVMESASHLFYRYYQYFVVVHSHKKITQTSHMIESKNCGLLYVHVFSVPGKYNYLIEYVYAGQEMNFLDGWKYVLKILNRMERMTLDQEKRFARIENAWEIMRKDMPEEDKIDKLPTHFVCPKCLELVKFELSNLTRNFTTRQIVDRLLDDDILCCSCCATLVGKNRIGNYKNVRFATEKEMLEYYKGGK